MGRQTLPSAFPYPADAWENETGPEVAHRGSNRSPGGNGDARNPNQACRPSSTMPTSRQLGKRERATLLTIIAALAEHAGIDVSKPSRAAAAIEALTIAKGARVLLEPWKST